ncbi:MAG: hypothetical protein ACLTYN_16930 [Dysosmobacter welbionis]
MARYKAVIAEEVEGPAGGLFSSAERRRIPPIDNQPAAGRPPGRPRRDPFHISLRSFGGERIWNMMEKFDLTGHPIENKMPTGHRDAQTTGSPGTSSPHRAGV